MAKWQLDTILDQALEYIANNVTQETVCSAQPANYTEAVTTFMLARKTGLTSGSFTLGNGDTSGRKLSIGQQPTIPVSNGGTATHVALCSGSVLLYVTTCTPQPITGGNTVTIPAWDIEIADAS